MDIGSGGDISPVMTKLHSDTILPESPFLGLSQILSRRFFLFCTFFYDGIDDNTSREAGGELLVGLSVAYAMRHSPPMHLLQFLPDFPGPCVLNSLNLPPMHPAAPL